MYDQLKAMGLQGAGQMTIYDIACFVGDHMGVAPRQLYIHKGVIQGAWALGLIENKQETILPMEHVIRKVPALHFFQHDPDHLESFLCIKKDELSAVAQRD